MDAINFSIGQLDPFTAPKQQQNAVDFEQETLKEYDELAAKFKQKAKDEADKKKTNISTEYWFCAYFSDQEQRDVFLEKIGALSDLIDQYIPGDVLAEKLGVQIPTRDLVIPKSFRVNKNIVSLSETFSI